MRVHAVMDLRPRAALAILLERSTTGPQGRGQVAQPAGAFDVIVLGGGTAGLAAALAAHEHGLSAVLIEKAPQLGGISVHSYGLIWVGGNHLARDIGIDDSREEILAYMRFIGGGQIDDNKMRSFVERSPEALVFFERCGVPFRLVNGITDHYYGVAPGSRASGRTLETDLVSGFELGAWQDKVLRPDDVPTYVTAEEQAAWGGINNVSRWDQMLVAERKSKDLRGKGFGLITHLLKAVIARGVPVLLEREVEKLIFNNGRVCGVNLRSGEQFLAAKGVILATGGYHANPQLAREFEGLPGMMQEPSSLAPASITGDAIVLGGELGAIVRKVENNLKFQLAYTIAPARPGDLALCVHAGIVELCSPHTIVVNRDGRRFADETFFQGMAPALRSYDAIRRRYQNLPAWLIFDHSYASQFSFANLPAGSPIPDCVPRAQTLGELAGLLGVDADGLLATAERFNMFADVGVDRDFRRGEQKWRLAGPNQNRSLGQIATPPFYGVELHPTNSNSTGLLTDDVGRVIHQRRHAIPGLYATGYAAAPTESGIGYQAGILLAASMTYGYLAARDMAGLN